MLRVVFQITDVESGFIRWINADLVMHIQSKIGAIKNPALGGAGEASRIPRRDQCLLSSAKKTPSSELMSISL